MSAWYSNETREVKPNFRESVAETETEPEK